MTTHILLLFIIFLNCLSDVCLFSVSASGALIFYNRQDKKNIYRNLLGAHEFTDYTISGPVLIQ